MKQNHREMPFFPFQLQSNTSPSPFLAATPLVFTSAQSFPVPLPRWRASSGGGQSQCAVVYFCHSLLLILLFFFSTAPSFLFPLPQGVLPMACSPSGVSQPWYGSPLSRSVSPAMPQQCPLPHVYNSDSSTISPARHSCCSFLNLSDHHGLSWMVEVWWAMGCSRWLRLAQGGSWPPSTGHPSAPHHCTLPSVPNAPPALPYMAQLCLST